MAVALQLDGNDDRLGFANWVASGEFSISHTFTYVQATEVLLGDIGQGVDFLACISNGSVRFNINSQNLNLPAIYVAGTEYTATVTRDADNLIVFSIGADSVSQTVSGDLTLNTFGEFSSGLNFSGQYRGVSTLNDIAGGDVRTLDIDASSHSAGTPVITDTTSGFNATGVNMPTAGIGQAGSAWVDLGGSGISIAVTLGTIEYNSNDTTVGLAGAIDVIATLGEINYSSNNAAIQVSGDVNVIATLGAINYASNDTAISLFGNVDVTAALGTIDYNSNDTSVSLLGGINVNATLGAIDYTSSDTTITLQGQVALIATLGTISYDSNNVIVQVGTGQIIGNVTAGFAGNLYSAGFKPSEITVNFKT